MDKKTYVVETIYGATSEWGNELDNFNDALDYALAQSNLMGVVKARVWWGEEIVATAEEGEWTPERWEIFSKKS